MKISISRQTIYLLFLSIVLLIFVLLFSFLLLIPEGKEYRKQRATLKTDRAQHRMYQNFSDTTSQTLEQLQSENRHTITAFERSFNAKRFEKINSTYFSSLKLSAPIQTKSDDEFLVYEVNTTSAINTPQNFYDFLDAVNKSDWIIGINFPINFKRDAEIIRSSFTMKVYGTKKTVQK